MVTPTEWERMERQQRAEASYRHGESLGLLGGLGLGCIPPRSIVRADVAPRYGMSITKMNTSWIEKSFRAELQEEIDEWLDIK